MAVIEIDGLLKFLGFLGVQYTLGRRGSYPYGLLVVNYSLVKISVLVIFSDMIQTAVLLNFFDFLSQRIGWLRRFRDRVNHEYPGNSPGEKKIKKQTVWNRVKKYGGWGLVAVAALPYGGGSLTGSILAVSIKMNKWPAFFYVITGCIIGTVIFSLGAATIEAVI